MDFKKRNILMLIFLSGKNPIWRELCAKAQPNERDIAKLVRISLNTLANWKNGLNINSSTYSEIIRNIEGEISSLKKSGKSVSSLEQKVDFFKYVWNNEGSSYALAEKLGIEKGDMQKTTDENIYNFRPLFQYMYYRDSEINDMVKSFKEYEGIYKVYIFRYSSILLGSLRVRYPLELKGGHVIRCKLNLPAINKIRGNKNYWEYDGFITHRDHSEKNFWNFEKRSSRRPDFFYFITDSGKQFGRHVFLTGKYLTTGQDSPPSIVTDTIILERLGTKDIDAMIEHMHHSPKVLAQSEVRKLPAYVKQQLQGRAANGDSGPAMA